MKAGIHAIIWNLGNLQPKEIQWCNFLLNKNVDHGSQKISTAGTHLITSSNEPITLTSSRFVQARHFKYIFSSATKTAILSSGTHGANSTLFKKIPKNLTRVAGSSTFSGSRATPKDPPCDPRSVKLLIVRGTHPENVDQVWCNCGSEDPWPNNADTALFAVAEHKVEYRCKGAKVEKWTGEYVYGKKMYNKRCVELKRWIGLDGSDTADPIICWTVSKICALVKGLRTSGLVRNVGQDKALFLTGSLSTRRLSHLRDRFS